MAARKKKSGKAGSRPVIMVTGAAGALARQVIKRLGAGYEIVAVDFRKKPTYPGATSCYLGEPSRRSFEDIFHRHKITGVIHLGRLESDESTPERRYNANVVGTHKLLQLCLKHGVEQVQVLSTFYVYGASPYNPSLLTEESPLKAAGLTQDLVDSVELENLCSVYLWRYPQLNLTILRPCHIAGPKVRNTMSLLLARPVAPVLMGFSPLLQFLHIDDAAAAIVLAFQYNRPGIYNVAPRDCVAYRDVLEACGCRGMLLPSIPPVVPKLISRLLRWKAFPSYLINYFKYSVIIDGRLFERTFDFEPHYDHASIFSYYRRHKSHGPTR